MLEDSERTDDFEATYGQFKTEVEGVECYMAGLPGFPENFNRDGILSGFLDARLLAPQVEVSAITQGTKYDVATGEEPGKTHHQWPGVPLDIPGREGFVSTYNACDTTALYLIGNEALEEENPLAFDKLREEHPESVRAAADYILSHVGDDNLFREFPPDGADKFALRISYWKDSVLPDASGSKEEPDYPVMYGLAHFMNARGLLSAAHILGDEELEQKAHDMFSAGIQHCMREDGFVVAEDQTSKLVQPSSDELHSLAYIPKEYEDMLPLEHIRERAKVLETDAGFACTPKDIADKLDDKYHGYVVWPFENAFIHYGATKFGLDEQAAVAERADQFIENGNEVLDTDGSLLKLDGKHVNDRQLWSLAAHQYFQDETSPLRTTQWL